MNELITNNIKTIDTLYTTAKYSGYVGNAMLLATGIGGVGLIATRIGYVAFQAGTRMGIKYAAKEGCLQLHLDSGIQRKEAHRFYEREGMTITGFHFAENIAG